MLLGAGHLRDADIAYSHCCADLIALQNQRTVATHYMSSKAPAYLGGGYSHRDVHIVPVDNLILVYDGIDCGHLLQGSGGGLEERGHEAQLEAMLLEEGVLVGATHLHHIAAAHTNMPHKRLLHFFTYNHFKSALSKTGCCCKVLHKKGNVKAKQKTAISNKYP